MKKFNSNSVKALAFSASAIAFVMAGPVYAQDEQPPEEEPDGVVEDGETPQDEPVDVTDTGATGEQNPGGITVTGSRIVRDTYSSISPLQVITTDSARNAGLFDPSQILQRDEAAIGTQIDSTFIGFVLDNGPGNQTVNLRGLGANRTLLLINGRRLAPSGVGGAPTAPSTNLLPSSLIDRVDLLLDGASSVYGSDAVAGVGNVVLRKDFDGLELFGSGSINPQGGGDDYTVSAAWGFNTDRAFFGIGAEYDYRDRVQARDRDFLAGCETQLEVNQNGDRFTTEITDQVDTILNSGGAITVPQNECARIGQGLRGSIIEPFGFFGVLYSTPGQSNSGVPNFSESTNGATGAPVDADGDGIRDIVFADYSTNGEFLDLELIPEQERYNVMAYGEYTFPGEANITPFFEALYSRVDVNSRQNSIIGQNVSVPDNNEFNPCNPFRADGQGVDCFNLSGEFAIGQPLFGAVVPQPVLARNVVAGDRNNFTLDLEQIRGVLGVRGDLPFIGSSWQFEAAGTYTRSEGKLFRVGTREDKLAFALGIDPTRDFNGDGIVDNDGDGIADDYDPSVDFGASPLLGLPSPIAPCDASQLANPELAAPDLLQGCVPVNLFSESLLGQAVGDFSSAAERDYVFGARNFDTTYEQIVLNAFVTGDLFELPAGPVGAVFGLEWREDSIDSTTDFVTSNGLLLNFNQDNGAIGSKWIREAFAELDFPLVAGKPLVEELSVNVSGRLTDEELYGTAGTFSLKGGWRPVSPLLMRFSYGTSFRAPNLRENFLVATSGFQSIVDPCAVPTANFIGGVYVNDVANPDRRDPAIIENCLREGRDPTSVGIDNTGNIPRLVRAVGVEIDRVGSLDLDPETSRSITGGFSFEERIGEWDLALSGTYYDIKIKESVVELSAQFAVTDCFARQDGVRSQFCDSLTVGLTAGDFGLITSADIGFLNLDSESVRGADFNARIGRDVTIGGELFGLGLDLRANRLIERSRTFIDAVGNETFNDFTGQFGLPKWAGRATFSAEWEEFLFTWQTRWVGKQAQAPVGVDDFADAFGNTPDGGTTTFVSDTCTGFGSAGPDGTGPDLIAGDGNFCRDVGFANDWFEHAASIRYRSADWELRVGVSNIFDSAPPRISCDEQQLCISNTPIGASYNLDGREVFATIRKTF